MLLIEESGTIRKFFRNFWKDTIFNLLLIYEILIIAVQISIKIIEKYNLFKHFNYATVYGISIIEQLTLVRGRTFIK